MPVRFREMPLNTVTSLISAGYPRKYFFPHRFHYLPRCGPDAFKVAGRMGFGQRVDDHWQLMCFADRAALGDLPDELFFDDRLNWHQQHCYRAGHIAWANLVLKGSTLFTIAHQSDLVQRIAVRREYKTKVESAFSGWHRLLLNAVGNFAVEQHVRQIRIPCSSLAIAHTDPQRKVDSELFERIYDRAVNHHFSALRDGNWWQVDVAENRRAIVMARQGVEHETPKKTICLCHDIEWGLGHMDSEPRFAMSIEPLARGALDLILETERRAGVRATYAVVGILLEQVREQIARDGHCIAFHSFDHSGADHQLSRCRETDYRLRGYRAPRSQMTAELNEPELCRHNFHWLASSAFSLKSNVPVLDKRVVKIPILFDDYDLFRGRIDFEAWRHKALDAIRTHDFVAFSLHDCYAEFWLPHYAQLLSEISGLGELKTLDEVADDLYLAAGL
jgi:hypothetical protein